MKKTLTFKCMCNSPEHLLYIEKDEEHNEVCVYVQLCNKSNFWSRLKDCYHVLLGKPKYTWDAAVLSPEDVKKMKEFL